MKVLLSVPYQDIEPYVVPNLGLGYVASALRDAGHDVAYLDCIKEGIGSLAWKELLCKNRYQAIGIQMFSHAYNQVKDMFKAVKAMAFMRGKDYVTPVDVAYIVKELMRHRIVLTYEAEADGISTDEIIQKVLEIVPIP